MTTQSYRREFELNRRNWNERTAIHLKSPFYDVEGFKAGRSTLKPIEVEELGDIAGAEILHLQCHFGLDTLSLQRLGARVTGVDLSDNAIESARALADDTGLQAQFIRSNLYDLPQVHDGRYQLVFTSYGAINWLPDLAQWAQIIVHFLNPGGTFYMVEFHPVGATYRDFGKEQTPETYPYFHDAAGTPWAGGEASYVGEVVQTGNHEWSHSIGDIMNALISAGLTIEFFHEFPVTWFQELPQMVQGEDGWWRLPDNYVQIPWLFSIKATKRL